MHFKDRILNRIQSAITSPSVVRILFYPTLFWNIATVGLSQRWRWYNRIDNTVVLGALPFRSITPKLIKEENIRGVVTLNEDYETSIFMHSKEEWDTLGVNQLLLATPDFNNAPSIQKLNEGVDFIKEFKDSDGSVYVHCKAGRGRSATLVACYLMKISEMTPEQAIAVLKEKREQTLLGSNQVKAIYMYYDDLQTSNLSSSDSNTM